MRFGSFMLAEYIEMFVISGIAVTFFLGGWHGPGPGLARPDLDAGQDPRALIFVFMWIRATLPRLRYDQLMSLGWKMLLPLATLNVLVTAVLVTVREPMSAREHRERRLGGFPYLAATTSVVEVQRGPEPGGAGGAYRAFGETLRGLQDDVGAHPRGPGDDPVPGGEDAGLPALPRPPQAAPLRGHAGSRSASAARCAPPPAPPTASASSPPRTTPPTASRPASATPTSTRSTSPAASSAATARSPARSTRSRWATSTRSPTTTATT